MDTSRIIYGKSNPTKRELAYQLRRLMTPAEKLLWQQLRSSQLHGLHFRRQQVIDGYIADFYCHKVGLVVEVDGEVHERQQDWDAQRDAVMSDRGLVVLRFRNDQIFTEMKKVLAQISKVAEERTARAYPPAPSLNREGESG